MTRHDELVPRPDLQYFMYLAEERLFRLNLLWPNHQSNPLSTPHRISLLLARGMDFDAETS